MVDFVVFLLCSVHGCCSPFASAAPYPCNFGLVSCLFSYFLPFDTSLSHYNHRLRHTPTLSSTLRRRLHSRSHLCGIRNRLPFVWLASSFYCRHRKHCLVHAIETHLNAASHVVHPYYAFSVRSAVVLLFLLTSLFCAADPRLDFLVGFSDHSNSSGSLSGAALLFAPIFRRAHTFNGRTRFSWLPNG